MCDVTSTLFGTSTNPSGVRKFGPPSEKKYDFTVSIRIKKPLPPVIPIQRVLRILLRVLIFEMTCYNKHLYHRGWARDIPPLCVMAIGLFTFSRVKKNVNKMSVVVCEVWFAVTSTRYLSNQTLVRMCTASSFWGEHFYICFSWGVPLNQTNETPRDNEAPSTNMKSVWVIGSSPYKLVSSSWKNVYNL